MCIAQRRFAGLGGFEVRHLRQFERQALFGQRIRHAVFVVYRERFAPVTLARENSVAQTIVHFHAADTGVRDIFLHGLDSLFDLHTVEETGVDHLALFGVKRLLAHIRAFDQRNDRQVEMFRKRVVAAVMCRNRHDSACAVACKHVIGDINRNLALGQRVDGIGACEHTRHAAVGNTLTLRAVLAAGEVSLHFFALLVGHHALHVLALRCQHHKRHAIYRVRTGGEDGKRRVLPFDGELHFCSFASSYPVSLRLF